jgi:DNA-binding response OmpR family regulator
MDATTQNAENTAPHVHDWAMIVDDDDALRAFVTEQFLAMNIEAVAAARGDTALRFAVERNVAPLIVLIDATVSGMDCLTLAAHLQQRFKRQTKIVILSHVVHAATTWPPEVCDLALLPKPFQFTDLIALVQQARASRPKQS